MAAAWVQDETDVTQDDGLNYSSVGKAFTSNVTAADLIAVAVGCDTNPTATCADTLGNSYTQKTATYDATNDQKHFQFYAKNISGGANTVTVTWSIQTSFNRLAIMEISGCDTTAPDDGGAAQVQAGGTTTDFYSSGNITTSVEDFIFGAIQNIAEATPGTGTLTAGATPAYTLRESGGTHIIAMETISSQSASTFDANFTRSVGHRCITSIMAFKVAGAAATWGQLLAQRNNRLVNVT